MISQGVDRRLIGSWGCATSFLFRTHTIVNSLEMSSFLFVFVPLNAKNRELT